jgi:type VI secretion system protein ImpK
MQLALSFQELFTIIARIRANRQEVPDLETFRRQLVQLLGAAKTEVERRGATKEESHLCVLAVVAAIDEAILSSPHPGFRDWSKDTLQTSLFGSHIAGETFFQHLRDLITADPSQRNSELLEVFQTCLLLGYRGRYGGREGDVRAMISRIEERIVRSLGGRMPLGMDEAGQEALPVAASGWPKGLLRTSLLLLVLAGLGFVIYSLWLSSRAGAIRAALPALMGGC